MDGKDLFMCGKLKRRKNERKQSLRLPASMRKMTEEANKANAEWRTSPEWLYGNKNLKQLGFNVLLRKAEPQRRKFRSLGEERSLELTKSNDQSIHGVSIPGDMLNSTFNVARFVLMEDGAASHSAQYTSREQEKQGISKIQTTSS